MVSTIALLISFLPEIPGIIVAIEQLIDRGHKTGELGDAERDALTALATVVFAKYGRPAPPPPGVDVGGGS